MSLNELGSLLAVLESGMQLFAPRSSAAHDIRGTDAHRDAEIAALAFVHNCDLLMNKPLDRLGEIGYLFSKRAAKERSA
jgi:hypothetical protein